MSVLAALALICVLPSSCCHFFWRRYPQLAGRYGLWPNWNGLSSVFNFRVFFATVVVSVDFVVVVVNTRFRYLMCYHSILRDEFILEFQTHRNSTYINKNDMTYRSTTMPLPLLLLLGVFFQHNVAFSFIYCTFSGLKKTMPWAVIFKRLENQIKTNTFI